MKNTYKALILVSVVHVYFCEDQTVTEEPVAPPDLLAEKQIFDSAEEKISKEINFENSPLKKLDEGLTQELRSPKALDVSFEVKLDVLHDLVKYEKNIKDLHAGVLSNSSTGVKLAKELLTQDGPRFLRVEVDREKVKQVYNWDDENVEHFDDLLNDIKSVYKNILRDLKDKPTPYEILFSKTRNDYM